MKKHTDKTNNDYAEKTRSNKSQKKPGFKRQGSNLAQSKRHDLETADKILSYIQEEEKF